VNVNVFRVGLPPCATAVKIANDLCRVPFHNGIRRRRSRLLHQYGCLSEGQFRHQKEQPSDQVSRLPQSSRCPGLCNLKFGRSSLTLPQQGLEIC
jgi:hypothetical protein